MSVQLNFTNNYYIFLASQVLSNNSANNTTVTSASSASSVYLLKQLVKTNGTNWTTSTWSNSDGYQYCSLGAFMQSNVSNNQPNTTFAIGSGNTPFTATDYELATPITSGFTVSLSAVHYNDGNDVGSLEYTILISNTGSDLLTINEIGIKKIVRSSISDMPPFLMARAVLDTPLEIPAGSSKTLTAKISMPLVAPSE